MKSAGMASSAGVRKKGVNPFLPLDKYIPDGEPHVFGGRVYLYGSHDQEGGHTFCMEDYEVFSAAVDDLTQWRTEGVIYRAEQDPLYGKFPYMYAPDCVRGNDGRYYLYYCMSGEYGQGGYHNPISVAVCDEPAGKFEYLGQVHWKDGQVMRRYVCFDPAVMNDDGVIRLYYGTQYGYEEEADFLTNGRLQDEVDMFGRSAEEILAYPDSINGAVMLTLEDDMLTVREEPRHIIPYRVKGTDFEEHPFFEASSMRKVGAKYYFIYSSWQNHELCYAVSDFPDRGFRFGGTIVSNGDVGAWRIAGAGEGCYPAVICCNLTNGRMPHGCNCIYKEEFPNVTNCGDERFIAEIEDGTLIGYKYWEFEKGTGLAVTARIENEKTKVRYDGPARVDERSVLDKIDAAPETKIDAVPETSVPVPTEGEAGTYFDVFVVPEDATAEPAVMSAESIDATAEPAGNAAGSPVGGRARSVLVPHADRWGERVGRIPLDGADPEADEWKLFQMEGEMPAGVFAVYLVFHSGGDGAKRDGITECDGSAAQGGYCAGGESSRRLGRCKAQLKDVCWVRR